MAMIIIEGMNRTEFCKPKNRDVDKRRFYETRGMLYRAYPDQFTKMRIYEYGVQRGTDEVIFYQENCIHPRLERGTVITTDKILQDIDMNKIMADGLFGKRRSWGILQSKTTKSLWGYIPILVVGVVFLIVFAQNGFKM